MEEITLYKDESVEIVAKIENGLYRIEHKYTVVHTQKKTDHTHKKGESVALPFLLHIFSLAFSLPFSTIFVLEIL